MLNLLRFEYRRLFKQKSFIVLLFVTAFIAFCSFGALKLYEVYAIKEYGMSAAELFGSQVYTGVYALRDFVSQGYVTTILALAIAIFVCSEYANGTLKTKTFFCFSRFKIYTAEFLVALSAAFFVLLSSGIVSFLCGSIFWEIGSLTKQSLRAILLQILIVLALTSFIFAFSKIIKRTGGAIAFGLFVPTAINLVLTIIDLIMENNKTKFADFWLSGCLSEVQATSPVTMSMQSLFALFSGSATFVSTAMMTRIVLVCAAYMAVSYLLGFAVFRKQEL